eukprot:gene1903-1043_t
MSTNKLKGLRSEKPTENYHEWVDISEYIDKSCSTLNLGEIICEDNFNLTEIMSAVEIMDEKMDINVGKPIVKTLEERKEELFKDLSEDEIISIIDELLCALVKKTTTNQRSPKKVSWFQGYTLPQSVQTCFYLHDLSLIKDEYFLIFVKSYLTLFEEIRNLAVNSEVREEDEFCPIIFDIEFAIFKNDKIMNEIEKLIKELKEKERYKMMTRLSFIKNLNHLHFIFNSPFNNLQTSKKYFLELEKELKEIKDSHLKSQLIHGFDINYCRLVNSPTPLKPKELISFFDTIQFFEIYFNDLQSIIELKSNCNSLDNTLSFISNFSLKNSNVVVRSILMNLIFFKQKIFGEIEFIDYIKKYIFDLPSITKQHFDLLSNSNNIQDLPEWLSNFGRCFILIIFSLLNNRSRCRRRLANLISEFLPLEVRAEQFDSELKLENIEEYILANITIDLTLFVMKLYLEMGFELNLYHQYEYYYIFWYLDYVSGMRLKKNKILYKTSEFKKKKKKKYQQQFEGRDMFLEGEYLLIRGISRLLSFFVKEGSDFHIYPFKYGSEKLTFENRFSPFYSVIHPTPLDFKSFKKLTNLTKYSSIDLLKGSVDSFDQSKQLFDNINEKMKLSNYSFQLSKNLLKVLL